MADAAEMDQQDVEPGTVIECDERNEVPTARVDCGQSPATIVTSLDSTNIGENKVCFLVFVL